jgi:Homeodomain-like domain
MATVSEWVPRYHADGVAGLHDRSWHPHTSPGQIAQRTERRVIELRLTHRWGPHRYGNRLRLPQSTVSKMISRYNMPW